MKEFIIENCLPISIFAEVILTPGEIIIANLHFEQSESDNPNLRARDEIAPMQQYIFTLPCDSGVELNLDELANSVNFESGEDQKTLFIRLASLKQGKN
jgi:hypothetical protein